MSENENKYIKQMKEHPRIQSYVADKYFVSTAWRECSAIQGGWYYETIVWEWDKTTKETGEMLFMGTGIGCHFDCCERLIQGKPLREEVGETYQSHAGMLSGTTLRLNKKEDEG